MSLAIAIPACHSGESDAAKALHAAKRPYEVTTTKLIFGGGQMQGPSFINWLDRYRILAPGYELLEGAGANSKTSTPGVYVLDTRTNQLIRHADLATHFSYCFARGFVAYSTVSTPTEHIGVIAGIFGEETALSPQLPWNKHPELARCYAWPAERFLDDTNRMDILALAPEDGYISIGVWPAGTSGALTAANQHDLVEMHRVDGSTVQLPIERKEIDGASTYFSDYLGKYVIYPAVWRSFPYGANWSGWSPKEPIPVYLLSHTGEVDTVMLPAGTPTPWKIYPSRAGWIVASNSSSRGNPADAGAWLLVDGTWRKMFDYVVAGLGVSPDGCKVAYQAVSYIPSRVDAMRVVNLCGASDEGARP